jgi:hypothetical protein
MSTQTTMAVTVVDISSWHSISQNTVGFGTSLRFLIRPTVLFNLEMGSLAQNESPLRLFLFDTARTNCQAFYKLFSQHPRLAWGQFYHGFSSAALYGPERIQQHLRHSEAAERAQIEWGTKFPTENSKTYESSNKDLVEKIDAAEDQGKIFFGKEHCSCIIKHDLVIKSLRGDPFEVPAPTMSNPTCIPDHILESFTPLPLPASGHGSVANRRRFRSVWHVTLLSHALRLLQSQRN